MNHVFKLVTFQFSGPLILFQVIAILSFNKNDFTQKYLPYRDSLVAQQVKNLPAMNETPVWFLGQEDTLDKG